MAVTVRSSREQNDLTLVLHPGNSFPLKLSSDRTVRSSTFFSWRPVWTKVCAKKNPEASYVSLLFRQTGWRQRLSRWNLRLKASKDWKMCCKPIVGQRVEEWPVFLEGPVNASEGGERQRLSRKLRDTGPDRKWDEDLCSLLPSLFFLFSVLFYCFDICLGSCYITVWFWFGLWSCLVFSSRAL